MGIFRPLPQLSGPKVGLDAFFMTAHFVMCKGVLSVQRELGTVDIGAIVQNFRESRKGREED
jgi:hypothetical protein